MLLAEGAKLIVVACNTASALAVPALEAQLTVPVVGVIRPGAAAAVAATRNRRIGVIGTRATVQSRAYERAILALDPAAEVHAQACPLLVPLIEEGWLEDPVTEQVIARYLDPMLASGIDILVLGCTHYPLLHAALERRVGGGVGLVDSAQNCALEVRAALRARGMEAPNGQPGGMRVVLTDPSTAFLRVAESALGLDFGEISVRVPV
jgi:glutamate racemase